jgi:capsular polysaccharide export protein
MNAIFLSGSYIDLHNHLVLADNLKSKLEIAFLVQSESFRNLLLEKGYSSFLYSELLSSNVRQTIESWWKEQKLKNFKEIYYGHYDLWRCTEFERKLILDKVCDKTPVYKRGLPLDRKSLEKLEKVYKYTAGLIEGFSQLLGFLRPEGVFVFNGLFLPTLPCAQVAKRLGTKVYFSEEAYFPKTMLIDHEGVNAASFLCGTRWSQIAEKEPSENELDELDVFIENFHISGLSRVESGDKLNTERVYSQLGIPDNKKIILFPAQVETDTNTILFSPNYHGNADVIRELARIISNYPEHHLVVKVHPRDEVKAGEFRKELGDCGTVVSRMNIHSLLEVSDIVIVINTTVGLEALTYNKPVIVLGKAIYSGKGFTFDISNRMELDSVFSKVVKEPFLSSEMQGHCRKFLNYLVNHYLYFIDDNEFSRDKNNKIERKIIAEMETAGSDVVVEQRNGKYFSGILEEQEAKKVFSAHRKERVKKRWQTISDVKGVSSILLTQSSDADTFDRTFNILFRLFPHTEFDLLVFPEIGDDKTSRYKTLQRVNVFSSRKKTELLRMLFKKHGLFILSVDSFYNVPYRPMLFSIFCRSKEKFVMDRYLEQNNLSGQFRPIVFKNPGNMICWR